MWSLLFPRSGVSAASSLGGAQIRGRVVPTVRSRSLHLLLNSRGPRAPFFFFIAIAGRDLGRVGAAPRVFLDVNQQIGQGRRLTAQFRVAIRGAFSP